MYLISIGSPGSGTVRRWYGRLKLRPLTTVDQVQLSTLLQGEGWVSINESQTIATGPQLRLSIEAGPVLREELKRIVKKWSFLLRGG